MVTLTAKEKERNEKVAKEIRDFLLRNEIAGDTRIYFNNKCYDSQGYGSEAKFKLITNINPLDYFEYANPKTVSMSFEGDFYNIMNYAPYGKTMKEFEAILHKYGLYYELGNAWNLSLYEV